MNVSDATLVSGVLGGDRSAFAELYDRRARVVKAVCFDMTHDFHAAADLTQEVFLRAFRNLGSLRDPEKFAAWLTGIARQVCREWRRGRMTRLKTRSASADGQMLPAARDDEPPDERISELRGAMAKLPDKERLALHSFYLQELDADRAREVLGLSRSGFYRVLSCARERLRRLMSRREVMR